MKRKELEDSIVIIDEENWYKENVQCIDCLREQYKQKKIDKEKHDKQLLKQKIHDLCKWYGCDNIVYDEDLRICSRYGVI